MPAPRTINFDGWAVRTDTGELVRDGRRIRLQDQPLQVLDALLTHPGELVTREELIRRLWPTGVVDFDTGLNSAVRKLRVALDDVGEKPRYIETVPRKGYRFIGTVDPPAVAQVDPTPAIAIAVPSPAPVELSPPQPAGTVTARMPQSGGTPIRSRLLLYAAAALVSIAIAIVAMTFLRRETATQSQSVGSTLGKQTIAVLPLHSTATDGVNQFFAQSVTELLRNRLAALSHLVVIAGTSTATLENTNADPLGVAEELHARFLLQGNIVRSADKVHLEVQFLDAANGAQLWSRTLDGQIADAAPLLDEVVTRVADSMNVPVGMKATSAPARINFDAYELYLRGQALMANERVADLHTAVELFRRATILDPGFARAYLALGQAQLLSISDTAPNVAEQLAEARRSVDRALELNPLLGEAWIERALSTQDEVKAEELFRKGLALAPSYGVGYAQFADFLFSQYRKGEAMEMIDRARQIDPRSPRLHVSKASYVMFSSSDVAMTTRLLGEALAINPQFQPALYDLAVSRWEYEGRFADAALIIERAIALDPESSQNRQLAALIYLDVEDPAAAANVMPDPQRPTAATVAIAQYRHDIRLAAELARNEGRWPGGPIAPQAEALRDEAIATGDFSDALQRMEARYGTGGIRMWHRGLAMVYAHTLSLADQSERGRKLATATMVQLDSESVGRTEGWFSRERASAFMVLGDSERALDELAAVLRSKRVYRWWYLTDRDPLFAALRQDPRFQALAEQARKHRTEQRALVDEMRRKGQIPRRDS